jgi:hypothetical protein
MTIAKIITVKLARENLLDTINQNLLNVKRNAETVRMGKMVRTVDMD